jgi:hypothetical protein
MRTKKRKLFLKKTTIAGLNRDEMKRLYGGLPAVSGCTENCITGGPDTSVHDTFDYTCP